MMPKNKQSEDRYNYALEQLHDSLQHHETVDVLIKVLKQRSDFHSMVFKSLCGYSWFWVVLVLTCLAASSFALNFPDLASWILSFIQK